MVHSDIKGTLIKDGNIVEKVHQLLVLFQTAGRTVILISSDPEGSQQKLEQLGVTEFSAVVDRNNKTLQDDLMSRYRDKDIIPRTNIPLELIIDDNEPFPDNCYTTWINPRNDF